MRKRPFPLALLCAAGLIELFLLYYFIPLIGFNNSSFWHGFFSFLTYLVIAFIAVLPIAAMWAWSFSKSSAKHSRIKKAAEKSASSSFAKTTALSILGTVALMIFTEKTYGPKQVVTIGITDFSPVPGEKLQKTLTESYVAVANEALGTYSNSLRFRLEKVGKPYSNVLDGVFNGRIDMAIEDAIKHI